MSESGSYRQILRSSSIIGGASLINILVGLVKMKVAAVLLGPAGVGMIGLLQSLMSAASAVSALGFGTVGTRQIAEAVGRDDDAAIAAARRALFWGTLGLAALGAMLVWTLRDLIAVHVLHDPAMGGSIGWLALGVALTVASGSQAALLNGLRRIGDLARVSIASGFASAALGVCALAVWGERGLLAFILATPLASFTASLWYVSRLPPIVAPATSFPALAHQWATLARLGAAFMAAGVVGTAGHLAMRILVQRELGVDALGQFQASWMIAMTYIGLVLGAMGTDYYPRLTATIRDHRATNALVNEQSEVALLLAGPLLLGMLGLAPWLIELLYSKEFDDAVSVLRWQVLGDVLKVASWPLGFVMLAAGDGRVYLIAETIAMGALIALTWIALPVVGVEATGLAFLGMYVLYLPLVYWLARRRTGFRWRRKVLAQLLVIFVLAMLVFIVGGWSKWLGAGLGLASAGALGLSGLARLGHMANLGGPLGRIAAASRSLMMKAGVWRD
ncbi:O-antigen translocase [Luteimonas sp. MHLX1A]|uniref:O-antigen translocase n=1 Tax=Alterluteimonas muca TaxID=2878684 RepID=UPI001E3769F9|nr:O-antigen translocase [Luteimonas sp. MHLX1A]